MTAFLFQDSAPLITLVLLCSLRIGVALAAMPAPFGDLAPTQARVAIGVLVSLAVCIPLVGHAPAVDLSALSLGRAAFGEAAVGAVIGLTARVTLAAAQVAGNIAGLSMGLGFAHTIDPTFGEEALPTTNMLAALGALIFFALQGHHMVLSALGESVRMAPPGEALAALSIDGVARIGASTVAHGLRIAAPVVATMFIVQLGTSFLSKAAPKLHLFGLSFTVAVSAGLLTLFVAAPSLARALASEILRLPEILRAVVSGG